MADYIESPLERIIEVHRIKKPPNGNGGAHPVIGPCASGYVGAFNISNWVYENLTAPSYEPFGGVYLNPEFCCPPLPRGYNPADNTYDNPSGDYVPGNGAFHVTISWVLVGTADPGSPPLVMGAWVFPSTKPYPPFPRDPYTTSPDLSLTVAAGTSELSVNIDATMQDRHSGLGTTIVFQFAAAGSSVADTRISPAPRVTPLPSEDGSYIVVDYQDCPEGAPPRSAALDAPTGFPPRVIDRRRARCGEFG
jgi:hypothetical protein